MSTVLEDSIYILPDKVNISNIESLKNELLEYIEKNDVVTLDGSIVEEIDAVGFQLILAAQKLCIAQSKSFSLIDASNVFRRILEITGLLEILEDE